MSWITWFLITSIFILVFFLIEGFEGLFVGMLLSLASSIAVAWLPFSYPFKVVLLCVILCVVYFGLRHWVAQSQSPGFSSWKNLSNNQSADESQKEFAVVVEAVDYSSGPGLRVMWQGQSWHAEVLEGPNFFEKGDRVEVIGRSGTSLKVVRIDS
jgi:membrane protein implicated in regulation of membrane protease activity